jgi:hypothetical protein
MTLLNDYNLTFASPPIVSKHPIYLPSPTLSAPQPPQNALEDQTGVTNSSDSISPGSRADLIDLTERQKVGGEPTITQTGPWKRPRTDVGRYSEYALRVLRKLNKDGDPIRTELIISSPHIQKALRDIMSTYAFYNLEADPIVICKPYAPLFHYRKELKIYADDDKRSNEERVHMHALMEQFYGPYLGETERIFAEEIPKGRVRFEYLWTLFRAEDDILHHTEHFRELHRVMHCEHRTTGDGEIFCIYTWRWGYNAGKFGPCSETIIMPKFSSTREIDQLLCFPVKLLEQEEQNLIFNTLIQRGKKWKELIKPSHQTYDGMAAVQIY